jgi:transposase
MKDSEALARLLQLNWLPEAQGLPGLEEDFRCEQAEGRAGQAWAEGHRQPLQNRWREVLKGASRTAREALELRVPHARIRRLEEEIEKAASENPQARLLMTIPGVGAYSALTILAEIWDISRFRSPSTCAPTQALSRACTSRAAREARTHQQGGKQDAEVDPDPVCLDAPLPRGVEAHGFLLEACEA